MTVSKIRANLQFKELYHFIPSLKPSRLAVDSGGTTLRTRQLTGEVDLQNSRVSMYMMILKIRMAGFDPGNTGATIRTANAGQIAFDGDENDDGMIDVNSERFYYALSYDAEGLADGTPCN